MRRSGIASRVTVLALAMALSATSCFPYGFAGGGLPGHIKTIAVLPFENDTPSAELQREVYEALRRGMQSRLGLREAPESRADALVRGTITRYDVDVAVGYSADPAQANTTQRRLEIALDVEIVDQTTSKVLWEKKNLVAQADYAERAEATGRRRALDKMVNDLVEGAQSQW